jgi:hypothetical protein
VRPPEANCKAGREGPPEVERRREGGVREGSKHRREDQVKKKEKSKRRAEASRRVEPGQPKKKKIKRDV